MRRRVALVGALGALGVGLAWWSWPAPPPSTPDAPALPAAAPAPAPPPLPVRVVAPPPDLPVGPFVRPAARPRWLRSDQVAVNEDQLHADRRRWSVPGPRARAEAEGASPDDRSLLRDMQVIRAEPQMRILFGLRSAVSEVRWEALDAGMFDLAELLMERERWLFGLGADGLVPPIEVQAHACAIEPVVSGDCPLDDPRAWERLRKATAAACADPLDVWRGLQVHSHATPDEFPPPNR